MNRLLLTLTLAALGTSAAAADPPARQRGEFLQMLDAVLSGSQMGPGDGWFKPGVTRYTWDRFRARFDADMDGRVTPKEFTGSPQLFAVLDRDGDGVITADDMDWSDNSTYARQLGLAQQLLRRADTDGNRKLSKEEWAGLYDRATKGKDALDAEGLRRILFPPSPPRPSGGGGGGPPKEVLVLGLLTGELGSAAEGPKLEAAAPDFMLRSPDEKKTVTLSDYRGKKPVVLIFGSFT
jgi:EF hand